MCNAPKVETPKPAPPAPPVLTQVAPSGAAKATEKSNAKRSGTKRYRAKRGLGVGDNASIGGVGGVKSNLGIGK